MTESHNSASETASRIAAELPYLRRYARALTGSQTSGDRYAAATLEAILSDPGVFDADDGSAKVALFRAFHLVWRTTGAPTAEPDAMESTDGLEERAQFHLAALTPNTREALLLRSIEEFRHDEIARIMDIGQDEAEELIAIAFREMEASMVGRVMIIEDEPLIAMDLRSIVGDMGHTVTGIARTRDQAVALGRSDRPDLILADIQLADNSSGIDAVADLTAELGDVPVIFITAFPDRLLTGEKPEPAFLITKPFSVEQVRSAVSQAMFFSSTETLSA
ncbi:response regulator [Rhodobaculum claviforme]|uniref:Response regulator n=1 Tax=Rhodobaculum claviforme TaxID=1549854 RepID=A0A934TLL9_9RHOB|nr:response regulator [Rhodobaculum claviforme]MBK5927786.1 response regulator [Rhodobaculum claviforme]